MLIVINIILMIIKITLIIINIIINDNYTKISNNN